MRKREHIIEIAENDSQTAKYVALPEVSENLRTAGRSALSFSTIQIRGNLERAAATFAVDALKTVLCFIDPHSISRLRSSLPR